MPKFIRRLIDWAWAWAHQQQQDTTQEPLLTSAWAACLLSQQAQVVDLPHINVVALVRGEEQYVFLYDDANKAELLRTLGRCASNPELSFTWYDAAVLSQRIRQGIPAVPTRFKVPR